jgi:alpha-D-ribose 1-methylphosphonate 5-triphosphate synthase subunit PhnL
VLTVYDLAKRFTVHALGGKTIPGFAGVSFRVPAGGAIGLRGPSGSGKSSALKCIYRTYLPTAGRIAYRSASLGDVDLAGVSEHDVLRLRSAEIGYATQFLHVMPRVSAVDVVAEPAVVDADSRDAARRRAAELLERLHIPRELFDAHPVTFSGGEQQRVNIARAVIRRPHLLLLDEPTASLDLESVRLVVGLLREIREQGTTMVVICHDPAVMAKLADEVYTMPSHDEDAHG